MSFVYIFLVNEELYFIPCQPKFSFRATDLQQIKYNILDAHLHEFRLSFSMYCTKFLRESA